MAKTGLNGNLKWLVTAIVGIVASYAVLAYTVQEMKPKVETAIKHVIEDEIITPQMQSDIDVIQADVKELLKRIPE